ncbi:hypothetical protein HK102_013491 [Quaeritorhiza haematococci]|nr:hypothetical protein HK102_013491 [Quaeritorhiza haematococci]
MLKHHGEDNLVILNVDANAKWNTYDGVDVCGDKCTEKVEHFVAELEEKKDSEKKTVTKVSFMGYSLGGLIVRYAIGKLYAHGFFNNREAVNFITVASPHLGVRRPLVGLTNRIFNTLSAFFTLRSGRQMNLVDSDFNDSELPLLLIMADPRYCFYQGLMLFQRRVVYANTRNDFVVRYTTASISATNPYRRHAVVPLPHVDAEKYPSLVTHSPSEPLQKEGWTRQELTLVGVLLALSPVLIPLWLVLLTSGLSSLAIYKTVNRRMPDVQWFEKVRSKPASEGTSAFVGVNYGDDDEDSKEKSGDSESSTVSLNGNINGSAKTDIHFTKEFLKDHRAVRLWMVESLNKLSWEKFDVSIRFTNAHAAIIVRNPTRSLGGESVVRHLVEHFVL